MQRTGILTLSVNAARYLPMRAKGSGSVILENPSAAMLPMLGKSPEFKAVWMKLEEGKKYRWCACGLSYTQPWCNDECKRPGLTTLRPVEFRVETSGDYKLCNCKKTQTRPICDETHKTISKRPASLDATRMVMFHDSPAYEGVARKLGYKPKNGGFQ